MRGHVADLAVREATIEQRVVEHDAPRRADSGDIGVGRRRAPARVGDEDVVDVHPHPRGELLDLRGEPTIGQGLEAVEERLEDEGLGEHVEHGDPHERRRACDPPAPPEPAGEPHRSGHGDRGQDGLDGQDGQLVDEPAAPALRREAEVVAADEPDRAEGQLREPHAEHDGEADEDGRAHAAATERPEPRGERPSLPDEERQHEDLDADRGEVEGAGDAAVVVAPRELRRREVVAGIEARKVEVGHLRAPEQGGRGDPERGERGEREALR